MYEFQSILFNTASDLCNAVASAWLSAGGRNTRKFILDSLRDATDAELAEEVINEWDLNSDWMAERRICREDIERAFSAIRENPAAELGWED